MNVVVGLDVVVLVVFLILKLVQVGLVASWSWWWVFSPIWLPTLVIIGFKIIGFILKEISDYFSRRDYLKRMMKE